MSEEVAPSVKEEVKVAEVAAPEAGDANPEQPTTSSGPDNNVSSKSSDISIEEIGAELKPEIEEIGAEAEEVKTDDNAEVIVPKPDEEKEDEVKEKDEGEKDEKAPDPAPQESPQGMVSVREILEENDDLELEDDEDDDDVEDETLMERLVGLTEMFPDGFTDGCVSAAKNSVSGVKWLYSASRSLTWVVFSTASILFLPVIIETQLLEIEEAAKQQQRQILLGPGSAVSAGQNAPLPKAPV